ncbi:FUSC family protein [Micromonospora sp. NPDC004704]
MVASWWRRSLGPRLKPPLDAEGERLDRALDELRRRGESTGRDRYRQLQTKLILAVQAGVAAALSWLVAHELMGDPAPIFAPAAAVGTIASSIGQRLGRSVELILGVAVGIAIGDGLIAAVGTGPWQIGLTVTLAIITAIVISGRGTVVSQAGGTAVFIAALTPSSPNLEGPRFLDAVIGGAVGLIVVVVLLPISPLRLVERAAHPALDELAEQLSRTAQALAQRDAGRAEAALDRLREIGTDLERLRDALAGAKEVVDLAPARWHRRRALSQFQVGVEQMDRAVWNSRGLIRRAVVLIEDNEPVPASLPPAVKNLSEAIRLLNYEFTRGWEPREARRAALRAVSDAGRARAEGVDLSGTVVVAQIRSAVVDLLRATSISRTDARSLVRDASNGQEPVPVRPWPG